MQPGIEDMRRGAEPGPDEQIAGDNERDQAPPIGPRPHQPVEGSTSGSAVGSIIAAIIKSQAPTCAISGASNSPAGRARQRALPSIQPPCSR